jgi:S1-C subfamily serine protease
LLCALLRALRRRGSAPLAQRHRRSSSQSPEPPEPPPLPPHLGPLALRHQLSPPPQPLALLRDAENVILEIAKQRVFTPEDFRSVVEQLPADKPYPMSILRSSEKLTLEITPVINE